MHKPPRIVPAEKFLKRKFRKQPNILDPWLPVRGAAEIHGSRGLGKTHIGLGIAVAIASGGSFLRWKAPRARRVLLIDGEMPAALLQTWLAEAKQAAGVKELSKFFLMADGIQQDRLPRMNNPHALHYYAQIAEGFDVIMLDNLSSLCGRAGDMWSDDLQHWLLALRRKGKTLIFFHHTGKNKLQRGTSHKEDNLDSVLFLKRPMEYTEGHGVSIEVHYEKHRAFYGEDAEPFQARLINGRWVLPNASEEDSINSTKQKILSVLAERKRTTSELHAVFQGRIKGDRLQSILNQLQEHGMVQAERFGRKGRIWSLVDLARA